MIIFAKRIKELRAEYNLTQQQFADIVGVSQSMIALWEQGKSEPKATNIVAIVAKFNVTSDYLLGISDY